MQKSCLLLLFFSHLVAAGFSQQALQSLIDTEREFSKTSVTQNTRQAFLTFMSDSGLILQNGKMLNAKQMWMERKADSSELYWFPDVAGIATAGDLGYTSGPWTYKGNRTDKDPVAYGHFNTIWKKQGDGSWKAVVDMGVSHPRPVTAVDPGSVTTPVCCANLPLLGEEGSGFKNISSAPAASSASVDQVEREFISSYDRDGKAAYKRYVSSEVRFYRSGAFPIFANGPVEAFLHTDSPKVLYTIIKADVSASGDLGYVYGSTVISKDASNQKTVNYMRIWKREGAGEWKIVLDVIAE